MFGYIRKSKILEIIYNERHELINKIDKHKCNGDTEQDRITFIYEFSNFQGGVDALTKLYDLIERRKLK